MITFDNTISVDRPAADIYAYLRNVENTPEWNWAITETTKATQGPIAVGTRYRQVRTVPYPATETLEITALDPNRQVEIQGTLAALPARLNYDLIEVDGGTRIVNTVNLEPRGPLRLASRVLGARIKKAVARNLTDLKMRLEGAGPAPSRPPTPTPKPRKPVPHRLSDGPPCNPSTASEKQR